MKEPPLLAPELRELAQTKQYRVGHYTRRVSNEPDGVEHRYYLSAAADSVVNVDTNLLAFALEDFEPFDPSRVWGAQPGGRMRAQPEVPFMALVGTDAENLWDDRRHAFDEIRRRHVKQAKSGQLSVPRKRFATLIAERDALEKQLLRHAEALRPWYAEASAILKVLLAETRPKTAKKEEGVKAEQYMREMAVAVSVWWTSITRGEPLSLVRDHAEGVDILTSLGVCRVLADAQLGGLRWIIETRDRALQEANTVYRKYEACEHLLYDVLHDVPLYSWEDFVQDSMDEVVRNIKRVEVRRDGKPMHRVNREVVRRMWPVALAQHKGNSTQAMLELQDRYQQAAGASIHHGTVYRYLGRN